MKSETIKFLDLLFDSNESICVSPNKYAYYSIPLSKFKEGSVTLINSKKDLYTYRSDRMELVAINPINGWRTDQNVTALRSFLVEIDKGSLKDQLEYIKSLKMPYSACVFSGGKSLHFAITLDSPIGDIETYKYVAKWILKIASEADQQTINPSRSIRVPGIMRLNTKNEQRLVELKGRISLDKLNLWLSDYEHLRPPPPIPKDEPRDVNINNISLPIWVAQILHQGVHNLGNRNTTWFTIANRIAECGLNEDEAVILLERYYVEQADFPRREWEYTIRNAVKRYRYGSG